MLRHKKIRPKTFIHGYNGNDRMSQLAEGGSLTDAEYIRRLSDQTQDQRVTRMKRRRHVLKACDRCRVKKTKVGVFGPGNEWHLCSSTSQCDGKQPCGRCVTNNHPCLLRERKVTQTKVYSRGWVIIPSHPKRYNILTYPSLQVR